MKTPSSSEYIIRLGATLNDECDVSVDHATVPLTVAKIRRIIHLSKVATKENVADISDYDHSISFFEDDAESDEESQALRQECAKIVVGQSECYWWALLKHTDVHMESSPIMILELKEILKVISCPIEDLPLLMGHLTYQRSQDVLKARLTKGR